MSDTEKKDDNGVCMHCGGVVGDDGLARDLGDVDETSQNDVGNSDESGQQDSLEKLRAGAFADAIRRRGGR